MTPKEASKILGCTWQHVCHLCRTGRLYALKRSEPESPRQFTYEIHPSDVEWWKNNPPKRGRPWPRIEKKREPTGWTVYLDGKPFSSGLKRSQVRSESSRARAAWQAARKNGQAKEQA